MGSMPSLQQMPGESHRAFQQIVRQGIFEPMGMPNFGERLSEEEATLIHAWIISEIKANININLIRNGRTKYYHHIEIEDN